MSAGLQDISLYLCHEFGIAFNLYITNIHRIYKILSICVYIHIVIHHAFFPSIYPNMTSHSSFCHSSHIAIEPLGFRLAGKNPKIYQAMKKEKRKAREKGFLMAMKNCTEKLCGYWWVIGPVQCYIWVVEKSTHIVFGCFFQILLQNSLGRWQLFPFLWTSFCWCQIGTQQLPEVVTSNWGKYPATPCDWDSNDSWLGYGSNKILRLLKLRCGELRSMVGSLWRWDFWSWRDFHGFFSGEIWFGSKSLNLLNIENWYKSHKISPRVSGIKKWRYCTL